MLEDYYKYKLKYRDYVILVKAGNFFEIFDRDAIVIHKIFKYKLSKISDTIRCGFPVSNLNKFLLQLDEKQINYIVIVDRDINNQQTFENNRYNRYVSDIDNYKYNILRIDKIIKYLNENAYEENFSNILDEIEKIIMSNV